MHAKINKIVTEIILKLRHWTGNVIRINSILKLCFMNMHCIVVFSCGKL